MRIFIFRMSKFFCVWGKMVSLNMMPWHWINFSEKVSWTGWVYWSGKHCVWPFVICRTWIIFDRFLLWLPLLIRRLRLVLIYFRFKRWSFDCVYQIHWLCDTRRSHQHQNPFFPRHDSTYSCVKVDTAIVIVNDKSLIDSLNTPKKKTDKNQFKKIFAHIPT